MASHLTPVALTAGQVLNEAGARQIDAYFPLSCMVSNVAMVDGVAALEVGLVGHESMVGTSLALGFRESPVLAIVQGKGTAIRLPAAEFQRLMVRNSALRAQVYRSVYSAMAMSMIIAACNKAHGLEQRLARWLLMTRDCLSTSTFELTQVFLGQMLGVHRPSVNLVASALQRRGLISYRRGVVKLLDIPALKASSCTCYAKMRQLSSAAAKAA